MRSGWRYLGVVNSSGANIVQNVITGNSAGCGGGVYWAIPDDSPGPKLFNNTIVDNNAPLGAGIYASGDNRRVLLTNNIIVEADSHTALYCTNLRGSVIPLISFNNVFAPQGIPYGGQCTDHTGTNRNISADPRFLNPTIQDYRLQSISSSVDAGDNFASGPFYGIDLEGHPRFVDGNGDGNVVIDMGAYEYGEQLPFADSGNDQVLTCNHNCQAVVTLDRRGSSDPDGDTLNFSWTGSFGTVTGPTPTITLSKGQHEITLTVDDGKGGVTSDTMVVTVSDQIAPVFVNLTVTPGSLLKANHQMVPVRVGSTVTDNVLSHDFGTPFAG
jgi:hypothetical protein